MALFRRGRIASLMLFASTIGSNAANAGTIWIEGESASKTAVVKHGWYDSVDKSIMSGGNWLSHYDAKGPGKAIYNFEVAEPGSYTFWWRGNPFKSNVSYRLNDGKPATIDVTNRREEVMISEKPDHRFLAWVKVGKVDLVKGKNTIAFVIQSEISNHGGIDCFVFDNTGFIPSGAQKPGEGAASNDLAGPDEAIWIEGEDAARRSANKHPWYDSIKKDVLSGGDWLSHFDPKPGTAAYDFEVKTAGDYTFWWRGNPFAAKVAYKIDNRPAAEIDFGDKRGELMVSDKPDLRFLAWIKVGKLNLTAGKHSIAFSLHSDNQNHGAIDCFCFSRVPFIPSGIDHPRKAPGASGPGDWFPVVFDDDTFSSDSAIDMSALTEAPAGTKGFLRPSGDALKFEKSSESVQFWGVGANLGASGPASHEQLTQRAKYLRKHGVNMVRQHTVVEEVGMPGRDGKLDPERLDRFDWWCAELKRNGIYMTWSVFYRTHVTAADGYDPSLFSELDVLDAGRGVRDGYGLVNIEPGLQEIQLRMVRALLLHTNKYTGLRPVDDPGLAVLEFQNEDCIFFFFPLSDLAAGKKWPLHSQRLRKRFFEWAKARYKTTEMMTKAWGGKLPADDFAHGELQLMGAHHFGGEGPSYEMAGKTARAGDQIRFMTELQRGFYARREKEVRDLGFKAVTVTTAWRAGGASADPANLYCDTAAEMIDRHNYFGGGVGGHNIAEGSVNNESHLAQPGGGLLSIGLYQVEGRPFACTEWTQLPPNLWKVEAAPLIAFYGMGLQGWDASYHFTSSRNRPGEGWPDRNSYVTDTPHYIGQFPALAFAVRKHHVKQAPIVASRRLKVDDLFTGIDPLTQDFTGGGYDAKALKGNLATPAEALAVGRVTVGFSGGQSAAVDLKNYWLKEPKVVRSITDELVWDYGRQVVRVQTPKTQAVIGNARGSTFVLPGATISAIKTPFVSLILTPLDDLPLADSRRILVTAMARDAQVGTRYSDDGKSLLKVGGPPLLMEPVQATITLKGGPPKAVNALDLYGVPTGKAVPIGKDGGFAIDGQYRTYYYEIKR